MEIALNLIAFFSIVFSIIFYLRLRKAENNIVELRRWYSENEGHAKNETYSEYLNDKVLSDYMGTLSKLMKDQLGESEGEDTQKAYLEKITELEEALAIRDQWLKDKGEEVDELNNKLIDYSVENRDLRKLIEDVLQSLNARLQLEEDLKLLTLKELIEKTKDRYERINYFLRN